MAPPTRANENKKHVEAPEGTRRNEEEERRSLPPTPDADGMDEEWFPAPGGPIL